VSCVSTRGVVPRGMARSDRLSCCTRWSLSRRSVNLLPRQRSHFGHRFRDGKRHECTEHFLARAHARIAGAVFLFACLDSPRANLAPSPALGSSFGFTVYSLWMADLMAELQLVIGIAARFAPEWERILLLPAVAHGLLRMIQEGLVDVTKDSEANTILIWSRTAGLTSSPAFLGEIAVESTPRRGECLEIALAREACG
jgi:hypothetical protein